MSACGGVGCDTRTDATVSDQERCCHGPEPHTGHPAGMSFGWEIRDDDVDHVLQAHGISDEETRDAAIDAVSVDSERVERAALVFDETDDQIQAALSEIELILIEQGLLPEHEIRFVSPVEQDLQDKGENDTPTKA